MFELFDRTLYRTLLDVTGVFVNVELHFFFLSVRKAVYFTEWMNLAHLMCWSAAKQTWGFYFSKDAYLFDQEVQSLFLSDHTTFSKRPVDEGSCTSSVELKGGVDFCIQACRSWLVSTLMFTSFHTRQRNLFWVFSCSTDPEGDSLGQMVEIWKKQSKTVGITTPNTHESWLWNS